MENRIKVVAYSRRFLKAAKGLSSKKMRQAEEKERIFRGNPFSPVLKTHKLAGKEKEAWAFWINYTHRIKFLFLNDKEVLFLDIGTHEIYK